MTMALSQITREDRVRSFYEAAGNKTYEEGGDFGPLLTCFSEELGEFNEAMAEYLLSPDDPEKRKALVKEWADVQFTLSAFPWFFDFNGQVAFTRVANNNDTKISPDGKVYRRSDGKIIKPDNYVACDMGGL